MLLARPRPRLKNRVDPKGAQPVLPASAHPPRNKPCPCGNGRKFKHCHGAARNESSLDTVDQAEAVAGGGERITGKDSPAVEALQPV